jgi:intein/homing endonuclease
MVVEDVDPYEGQEFINIDQLTSDNPNLPKGLNIVKRETSGYQDKFVFEPYIDDNGDSRRYPVPMRWHLTPIVQNILAHNKSMQYTGIVEIGMCLVAGSKVVLADGSIKNIESLGSKHLEKIDTNIRTTETENDIATRFHRYENMKTIEVITSGGRSIRGTPNHPLMVDGKWIEIQHLKVGDPIDQVKSIHCDIKKMASTQFESKFIKYTNGVKINKFGPFYKGNIPTYVDDRLASLMGYIIGDGWVARKNKSFGFVVAKGESDLEPILRNYVEELFGIKPYIRNRRIGEQSTIHGRHIVKTQILREIIYYSKPVAKLLSMLRDKRIPEMIFCSPNIVLSKFLSWLFEADGSCTNCISVDGRHKKLIEYTSINIELLRDIQIALLRFGIGSRINSRNKKTNESYKLSISRKDDVIKFISNIGFQSIKKRKQQSRILIDLINVRSQKTEYIDKIVDIIHHTTPVTVYDIEVPKSHRFITNGGVISHNSGTGKTTLTRSILHKMHMMGENYRVLWFTGADMLNIDKIINSCQVGIPHVFVFDDASYTMEDAKKEDVARLANALTTIRHHLKSRAIIIMNIHYSKATKKFFRNQHFTFLTSVTVEELGNYSDLFKEKMGVVRKFAKYYNQMSLKGGFYLPVSSATYEQLYYKTNKPFRLGLVAEISDLHFFLFNRQECETCNPMTFKKIQNFSVLKADLVKKYGFSKVRSVLQFFAMIYDNRTDGNNKKKIQYLNNDYIAIWKNLAEINRNVYVPWGEMLEELRDDIKIKKKTHKPGGVKKFREKSVMSVMEQYKKELENPNNDKKDINGEDYLGPPNDDNVSTTGYDSTFVGSKNSIFDGDKKRR